MPRTGREPRGLDLRNLTIRLLALDRFRCRPCAGRWDRPPDAWLDPRSGDAAGRAVRRGVREALGVPREHAALQVVRVVPPRA